MENRPIKVGVAESRTLVIKLVTPGQIARVILVKAKGFVEPCYFESITQLEIA